MDEEARRADRAMNDLLLFCAVRALMRSHPDANVLRAAWDHEIAALWPDHLRVMQAHAEIDRDQATEALRRKQAAWEALIARPSAG